MTRMATPASEVGGARRAAYVAVILALAVLAWIVFGPAHGRWAVGAGVGVAWGIQSVSFWILAARLESGEPATRAWIAGIAGRLGGVGLVWGGAAFLGGPVREPVLAYAFAVVTFLLLEAAWLTVTGPGRRPTGDDVARR